MTAKKSTFTGLVTLNISGRLSALITTALLICTSQVQANIVEKVPTIKPETIAQSKIPIDATVMPAGSGIVNPGGRINPSTPMTLPTHVVSKVKVIEGKATGDNSWLNCNRIIFTLSKYNKQSNNVLVVLGQGKGLYGVLGAGCNYKISYEVPLAVGGNDVYYRITTSSVDTGGRIRYDKLEWYGGGQFDKIPNRFDFTMQATSIVN